MHRHILIWLWVLGLSVEVFASDSTRVTPPIPVMTPDSLRAVPPDSGLVPDSSGALVPPKPPLKPFKRLTPHLDSLMILVYGANGHGDVNFDLPQASSRFDYDPLLFRFSSSQWGEFETVYPAGLSPSMLSRVDPLTGDESFANPVPSPGSEEFLRLGPADRYYLLSPTTAGLGSPFGRPFVLYRQEEFLDGDISRSQIFVTHGTGGFANTAFTFANHFGPAGIVNADGTFIRRNRDYSYSGTKLNRLRLVSRPHFARNLDAAIGLSINRMNGDKLFRPQSALYYGDLSDHYSAISAQALYYQDETVNYRASLVYRNDDQKVTFDRFQSSQRFQSTDLHLVRQTAGSRHNLEISGDIRYLRYTENEMAHNLAFYSVGISDMIMLSKRVNVFGNISLRGSNDLGLKPTATLALEYSIDSLHSLAMTASRGLLLPQPEMIYLRPVYGALFDTTTDYRISGNDQLESGVSSGIELSWRGSVNRYFTMLARAGYIQFSDLPRWEVDYLTYTGGDYRAVAADRNLIFTSLTAGVTLPKGIFGQAAYAFRNAYKGNINLTEGPQHMASGQAGIRFPIHKLKIMVTAAIGGRFRSVTTQFFGRGGDDARFLTEAYLSFDLKSFHFFWNYANLLDVEYRSGGYRQPARSIWWGFTWAFVD